MNRRVGSVKIAPKGAGCEVTDCVCSTAGMDKWQALLNTVVNLQVP